MIKKSDLVMIFKLIIFVGLYILLFIVDKTKTSMDILSQIILFCTTIFCTYKFSSFFNHKLMEKYKSKYNKIFIIIITMVISFMMVGHNLFLTTNHIEFGILSSAYYFATCVWLYPIIYSIIYFFEWFSNSKIVKSKEFDKNLWIKIFVIALIFWGIYLFSQIPGTVTSDSIDQWLQAVGVRKIGNAHPPLLTFVLRFFSLFSSSPMSYICFQVICSSLLISRIFNYFHKHGLSKIATYVIAILFIIMPCNYLNVSCLWKDIPYAIGMLWLTFLLIRYVVEKEAFINKWYNIVQIILATTITALVRYNGIGPFILLILLFLFLGIYNKKFVYIFITILLIVSYWFVSGPVYKMFNVVDHWEEGTQFPSYINLITRPTGLIYMNDGTLSKESTEIVERYATHDLYVDYFDPYNGDTYSFNNKFRQYQSSLGKKATISTGELIKVYAELLRNHPMEVIKERLDGSDLLWNMSMPKNSFNHRLGYGVWLPANMTDEEYSELSSFIPEINKEQDDYVSNNFIAKAYIYAGERCADIYLLDNLFYRGGIWISFFLIGFIFMLNHKKSLWISTLPILGTTATWIVLMAFPVSRYIWYLPVCVYFFLIAILVCDEEKKKKENKKG